MITQKFLEDCIKLFIQAGLAEKENEVGGRISGRLLADDRDLKHEALVSRIAGAAGPVNGQLVP